MAADPSEPVEAAADRLQDPASTENGHPSANGTSDSKKSKTDKRKEKKKKQKQNKQQRWAESQNKPTQKQEDSAKEDEDIVIEYVSAPTDLEFLKPQAAAEQEEEPAFGGLGLGLGFGGAGLGAAAAEEEPDDGSAAAAALDPAEEFKKIFERFASAEELTGTVKREEDEDEEDEQQRQRQQEEAAAAAKEAAKEADSQSEEEDGGESKMSKKQRRMLSRLKIAELKQVCQRPDVVEVWDVTAADPELLVFLKGYRNSVSVPRHWSQKRKYLQGKRGIEKPPFELPDFIAATGISELRQTYLDKENEKKLKAKSRDRMAPKMGKMNIDYAILQEAFFVHQRPPPLTSMGELYYEGKEYEAKLANVRPGVLSDKLREALGMADGAPPPWLINMQRYGPPPSYPSLKVPGLNAPIPPGASFGYHPGGWGKPPVDEDGNPLYGDVFGLANTGYDSDEDVPRGVHWGELDPELEESEEESEEEEEEDEEELAQGIATGMTTGLASGIASSLPSGIETPDVVNLRKGTETGGEARPLYQVLEQKAVPVGQGGLLGTDHVYVMPTGQQEAGRGKDKRKPDFLKGLQQDVEIALTPEELEGLDDEGIRGLYEEKLAAARAAKASGREDFSDMVAGKAAQQKRKLAQQKEAQAAKRAKSDFKF